MNNINFIVFKEAEIEQIRLENPDGYKGKNIYEDERLILHELALERATPGDIVLLSTAGNAIAGVREAEWDTEIDFCISYGKTKKASSVEIELYFPDANWGKEKKYKSYMSDIYCEKNIIRLLWSEDGVIDYQQIEHKRTNSGEESSFNMFSSVFDDD